MDISKTENKIIVNGETYNRFLIKTHIISNRDSIEELVDSCTKKFRTTGDTIVISERIIAIMQGRSYSLDSIQPSFWAKLLYPHVSSHPGGIGLKSPWTMQLAIQEAGLVRIFFAAFVSAITRPFGIKGLFYHLVGNDINAIDGPCDYTLPPGNTSAKLGPKNPMGVAQKLSRLTKCKVVIIDANDYGVRILGHSSGVDVKLVEKLFADNPMGQSNEQTPLVIMKK